LNRVLITSKTPFGSSAITDGLSGTSVTQSGGSTVLKFSRALAVSANSAGVSINANNVQFVWAVGPGNTFPSQHTTTFRAVATAVNLAAAGSAGNFIDSNNKIAHGSFMLIGWGILLPSAMLVSRYFRGWKGDGSWYKLYVSLECAGLFALTVGFLIAVGGIATNFATSHAKLGLALFLLVWLQPLGACFRPKDSSDKHATWNIIHGVIGYILLFIAMVNIFLGITWLNPTGTNKTAFLGVYIFVWLLTLLTIFIFEVKRFKNRKSGETNV
jgi:hypothetical protein